MAVSRATWQRVFVVVFRMLGDAVVCTPTLDALKRAVPDVVTTVLLSDRVAPLFVGHPSIDHIVTVPHKATLRQKLSTMYRLRREPFDLALSLRLGSTGAAYAWSARCPRFGLRDRSPLVPLAYTRTVDPEEAWRTYRKRDVRAQPLHQVENRFALLLAAGVDELPGPMSLPNHLAAEEHVARRLSEIGLADRPIAVVQPTATADYKRWPPERFGEVADHLIRRHGLAVVVTTGPGEAVVYERVATGSGAPVTHLPGLPLPELAALLRRATLYIGGDTGPTHMAAAVGCPVVGVYGISRPWRWSPWRVPCRTVNAHSPSPTDTRPPRTIADIGSAEVMEACDELLREVAPLERVAP